MRSVAADSVIAPLAVLRHKCPMPTKFGVGLFGTRLSQKLAVAMLLVGIATVAACGDDGTDDSPVCISETLACQPPWPATYDEIFDRVLVPSCGSSTSGGACHYEAAPAGSLYLFDRDMAYNALVNGHAGGAPSVLPGDPKCSSLMVRLQSEDPIFQMPRGSWPLDEGIRCAFYQWIEAGAPQ